MKTNIFKKPAYWLSDIILLIPLFAGLILYNRLPDQIAVHFNFNFEPDGYASKGFAIIAIPLLMLFFNTILWFALYSDPKVKDTNRVLRNVALWLCPVLGCFVSAGLLGYALGFSFNLIRLTPLFIGILLMIMGNYIPKNRQNYTIGFRFPWTLNNKENWRKTNRLGGFLMVITGFILCLFTFLPNLSPWLLIGVLAVNIIIPYLYSYLLYKNQKQE